MCESLERRAASLVLAAGIAVPLSATSAAFALQTTKVPGILTLVGLGLVTLGTSSHSPRSSRRPGRPPDGEGAARLSAYAFFAAGIVFVAATLPTRRTGFLTASVSTL